VNLHETTADDASSADRIHLALPATAPYARVARLTITGLASRNGFTYDEVEDIRIAVGEVFGVLVEGAGPDHRLEFSCLASPEVIDVEVRRSPPRPIAEVGELSRQILSAVTDRADIDETAGAARIVKRQDPGP
jgi:hypothetical protein